MRKTKLASGLLSLAFTLAISFGLFSLTAIAADGHLVGDGSAEAPYEIADSADLAAFRDLVNATPSSTAHAVLMSDIDLENKPWERIYPNSGYITEAYAGTFDGAGHTIKGLSVSASTSDWGLFGAIGLTTTDDGETVTAVIKDLHVEGTVITSGNYVGGLVGRVNAGSLLNCSFTGTVSSSKDKANIGGLVGYVNGDKPDKKPTVVLSGCVSHATVCAGTGASGALAKNTVVGGLVGYAKYTEITNCYNTGTVVGTSRSGGIGGQLQNNVTVKNCYNIGDVSASGGSAGELTGFLYSSASAENCYYKETAVGGGTGKMTDCGVITEVESLLAALGSAYTADLTGINGGYPILAWEIGGAPTPKKPELVLSDVSLDLTAGNEHPTATLTVLFKDMDETPILWSIESGETVIELITPENPNENNTTVIVRALAPGKAVIQAKTTDGAYSASGTVLAIPQITGREIAGTVAVGFTVEAKISVLGGKSYDYDAYPELSFVWKYLTQEEYLSGKTGTNDYHEIPTATNRFFTLPESLENCYLSYTVSLAGRNDYPSSPVLIKSRGEGIVAADRAALAFDEALPIKQNTRLTLANVGENGSQITWESSDASVLDPTTGAVTLPKSGIQTVLLTATLTYADASAVKEFTFTVYSDEAVKQELADKKAQLTKAISAVRRYGALKPVYGKDTNVIEMLGERFAAVGTEVSLKLTDIEVLHEGASVAQDGTLSYFFIDPNTAPTLHNGSLRVTFDVSLDEAHMSYSVNVIIPWDRARVEELMREEILAKAELNAVDPLTQDLSLPAVIDGKRYALVSWSSSDEGAVSVKAGRNQTLPYTGALHRGGETRKATLTAAFTFGFTMTDEPEIVLYKTFDVTVAPLDDGALNEIRSSLAEKLEKGFAKAGLRDAFTGKALTETDGVYEVTGDILYPTTRDFGIDGAVTPVSITSDNPAVIRSADVNNAARTEVLRPMVGEEPAQAAVTLTITDKESGVAVSKTFSFRVLSLTEEEIEAEKALLAKVRESYFEGIRGNNTAKGNIRYNLKPFTEVYEKDGKLVWVYDTAKNVGHGIVPTALDNWQVLEAWRLFRSSNPTAVTHENLLVTLQSSPKAVTVDSALSSETLGRYGKLYRENPEAYAQYAPLAELYYQPVSAELVVRGKTTPASVSAPVPVVETAKVTFTLKADKAAWIDGVTVENLPDGTTVFDVFTSLLDEKGYTYGNKGGYIYSITSPDGTTLAEMSDGPYSGWLYKVNGKMPDVMMSGYGIKNGDEIVVYYTKNYMDEFDSGSGAGSSSGSSGSETKSEETEKTDETDKSDEKTEEKPGETGDTDQKEAEKTQEPVSAADFTDIQGHWAAESIAKAAAEGWMNGVGEGLFAPEEVLSRAMFVTILYRYVGSPEVKADTAFEDVSSGAWYAKAVAWAVENGIVKGTSEVLFAPDKAITREQMALILYRYSAQESAGTSEVSFTDISSLSEESVKAIAWAFAEGLVNGMTDTIFAPAENATRAQAATIFVRFTA